MSLRTLQRSWDRLGATDPFWAILTDPKKKNNGWDTGEFFSTGAREVNYILERVAQLHTLPGKRRALDFGCGVGRLTQPLAEHFQQAWGVDISPSMIELARKHNRHGERCQYVLNADSDLKAFGDGEFDFIYSSITLQHIEPQFTKLYLSEFLRVLAPGGVLVFQLPAAVVEGSVSRVNQWLHAAYYGVVHPVFRRGEPVIEMHGIDKREVVAILESAGGRMLEVAADQSAGPVWESYRYAVAKAQV